MNKRAWFLLKSLRPVLARNFELLCWISALFSLAWMNPLHHHFSLCPLQQFGFTFCPGCGLGHSLSFLLHGDLQASLRAHPLGGFALLVILHRIINLIRFRLLFISAPFQQTSTPCHKTCS